MRNSQRPEGQEATPCQDTLRAFLAEQRMGGMFFHVQLTKHLARAGFGVRHVERENNHAEVWVLKLRRGQVSAGQEIEWTKRTVLVFLKRYGVRQAKIFADLAEAKKQATAIAKKLHQGESRLVQDTTDSTSRVRSDKMAQSTRNRNRIE